MPRFSRRPAEWQVAAEFVRVLCARTNSPFRRLIPGHRGRARANLVLSLLLAGLLLVGNSPNAAADDQQPGSQLTVIRSTPGSIVVALTVERYEIETLSHDGAQYQRVLIPDTAQTAVPGAPQAPTRGALLGLPATEGVALRVLEADCETLSPYRLYPAPQPEAESDGLDAWGAGQVVEHFAPDGGIYSADSFWPGALAELTETGYLRDQPVGQIQFYPVQFNPVRREIRICRRIVAEVTWRLEAQPAATIVEPVSPVFEGLLQDALLNYESLGRRTAGAGLAEQSSAPVEDTGLNLAAVPSATTALKIGVSQDGVYQLTYADLSNAGFNPAAVDPRTVRITNLGTEVPILVQGEGDGRFDTADYILFYGKGIRDAYTTVNVYWLSAGTSPGRRMTQRDSQPGGGTTPAHFPVLYHAEEDTAYWQIMPSLTGEDRWFWGTRLSPNTQGMPTFRDYTVHLGSISPAAATATVRVRLKGYTSLGHRTKIQLNGQVIDDRTWQGQVQFDHEASVPHSLLRDGDNVIRVDTVDAGASVDQILVNWIEIEYRNRYVAEGDQLSFGAPAEGLQRFETSGFASSAIGVLDVTDPATPVEIINASVQSEGGRFKVAFSDTARSNSRYLVLSPSRYLSPASISVDQPSTWKSPGNGADYIIITHEDFYDSALTLADHRRASGLRVATVKVGDLYDEFNHGVFNPRAIRDFLKYAYENWARPAPAYVLLLGDANQDYKDNLHNGTRNYVPSQNIESTLFGEVSSDNWFVMVSGTDSLPDMFIGRLVAQTRQEADIMVAKVIDYERRPPDSAWNTSALFVADDDESSFRQVSEQLVSRLPYYYSAHRVYAANYPPGDPRADIINHINAGSVLVNYVGHGEYYAWGRWNNNRDFMFHVSDVPGLNNPNRLPVVIVGNCLNGFFAGPKDNASLAEVLLRREDAGAVAVWAPTGLGYSSGHRILLDEFYKALFVQDQLALGAATTSAKIATYRQSSFWGELIATYVLFGDPATQLGIAANSPYPLSVAPANGVTEVPLDQALQTIFSKPMDPSTVVLSGPGISGISFAPSWNTDHTVVSWSHTGFEHSRNYQIKVNGQDRAGHNLGPGLAPNPWTFTTTTDITPPDGSIVVPGGNPSVVLTTSVLEVTFTEPVRPESVTYSIAPTVRGSLTWRSDRRSAVFAHERFRPEQTYTFIVLTAKDAAGNPLRQPVGLTFTVARTSYGYLPKISR